MFREQADPDASDAAADRLRTLIVMDPATVGKVLTPPLRSRLAAVADVVELEVDGGFLDDPAAVEALATTQVLLSGWGTPRITREVADAAPHLRAVVHAAGTVKYLIDHSLFERGLLVSSAAGANAVPVAEFTVAAIVFAGKRAFRLQDQYRRSRGRRDLEAVPEVGNHGTTVGVVGASRIGRLVLDRLRSYDVELLVSDPYLSTAEATELGGRLCDLETLFAESDVVSLHAPLLPETTGLVDGRLLGRMRDGAVLINTARGAIVEPAALEQECVSGRIDAVIDVSSPEPLPPESPLYDLPNVFLTPHIAGALGNEIARLGATAVSEIERLVAGQPFAHPVTARDLGRIA